RVERRLPERVCWIDCSAGEHGAVVDGMCSDEAERQLDLMSGELRWSPCPRGQGDGEQESREARRIACRGARAAEEIVGRRKGKRNDGGGRDYGPQHHPCPPHPASVRRPGPRPGAPSC